VVERGHANELLELAGEILHIRFTFLLAHTTNDRGLDKVVFAADVVGFLIDLPLQHFLFALEAFQFVAQILNGDLVVVLYALVGGHAAHLLQFALGPLLLQQALELVNLAPKLVDFLRFLFVDVTEFFVLLDLLFQRFVEGGSVPTTGTRDYALLQRALATLLHGILEAPDGISILAYQLILLLQQLHTLLLEISDRLTGGFVVLQILHSLDVGVLFDHNRIEVVDAVTCKL